MTTPAKSESASISPDPTEVIVQQLSPDRKALFSRLKTNKFVYSTIALLSFLFLASCSSTEATHPKIFPTLTTLPTAQETSLPPTPLPSPTFDTEWSNQQVESTATAWAQPSSGIEAFNKIYYEIPRALRDNTFLIKFFELDENGNRIRNLMVQNQENDNWGATTEIITSEQNENFVTLYGISNTHVMRHALYVEDPQHSLQIDLSQPQNILALPAIKTDKSNLFITGYKNLAGLDEDIAFFALRIPANTSNTPTGIGLENIDPNWQLSAGEDVFTLGYPIVGDQNIIFPNSGTYRRTDTSGYNNQITRTEHVFNGVIVGGASGSGVANKNGDLFAILNAGSSTDATFYAQDLPPTFFADFAKFQELAKQSMQPTP